MTSNTIKPAVLPLNKFPGEILNQIYDLALIQDAPIELWSDSAKSLTGIHPKKVLQDSFLPTRQALAVGLLLTCRKFRNEASSIFYSSNKFYFSGTGGWNGLWRFLTALSAKDRGYIKRLGVFAPLETEGYILKHCCGPTGDFDTSSSLQTLLEDPRQLVFRCCDLMRKEMDLQQLSFIIPPGVSVPTLEKMITDDWLITVDGGGIKTLREALRLKEDIVLELQPRGSLLLQPCCMRREMRERQWILSRN